MHLCDGGVARPRSYAFAWLAFNRIREKRRHDEWIQYARQRGDVPSFSARIEYKRAFLSAGVIIRNQAAEYASARFVASDRHLYLTARTRLQTRGPWLHRSRAPGSSSPSGGSNAGAWSFVACFFACLWHRKFEDHVIYSESAARNDEGVERGEEAQASAVDDVNAHLSSI